MNNGLKIIVLALICFISNCAYVYADAARIVFISDLHACVDSKDRSLTWNENSFGRIKKIMNDDTIRPTYLIWMGDIIDFVPAEWDIAKTWVQWVANTYPKTEQYAIMGNHDYIYYDYPEILSRFNLSYKKGYRATETETNLTSVVHTGDTIIHLENAEDFIAESDLILIIEPAKINETTFHVSKVKKVNKDVHTIEIYDPSPVEFPLNTTSVRQGYTEKRGIKSFLDTFSGTQTKATKSAFTIKNTRLILISMDSYYMFGEDSKTVGISKEDFEWLEHEIKTYNKDHNIIIVSHELPESGAALGNLYDPNDTTGFNAAMRKKLMALASTYQITAWIAGHTHPDARHNSIHSIIEGTHFFLVPSLGMGKEGQALVLNINNDSLDFGYWSTDQSAFFNEKIRLPAKAALANVTSGK